MSKTPKKQRGLGVKRGLDVLLGGHGIDCNVVDKLGCLTTKPNQLQSDEQLSVISNNASLSNASLTQELQQPKGVTDTSQATPTNQIDSAKSDNTDIINHLNCPQNDRDQHTDTATKLLSYQQDQIALFWRFGLGDKKIE